MTWASSKAPAGGSIGAVVTEGVISVCPNVRFRISISAASPVGMGRGEEAVGLAAAVGVDRREGRDGGSLAAGAEQAAVRSSSRVAASARRPRSTVEHRTALVA
jgi:hypothetical protein